jgi:short subunit dehydrogenase-like uncharacterized protein
MNWLLYGATGYTGNLIARRAVEQGMKPILAGRRERGRAIADELKLEWRTFGLEDPAQILAGLKDVTCVLNCAGPFSATFSPLVRGCLELGVHYLDVTGEMDVLEKARSLSAEAKSAKICLIPGVGFDVVPSDCLAAALARRLPSANSLELAIAGVGAGVSPGTLKTIVENIGAGSAIRRAGRIEAIPLGSLNKTIRFSFGERMATAFPWGDLATAYYSTSIPNITVYMAIPPSAIRTFRWMRPLLPAIQTPTVQKFLKKRIENRVKGPSERVLNEGRMFLWGRATSAEGHFVEATLDTGEGYSVTATTALAVVARVTKGLVAPGYFTPSQAFGPEFVKAIPNTKLTWSQPVKALS